MTNWQLTVVILASVLVGALIPLLIMAATAVYRAGKAVAELAEGLKLTLTRVETISGRVEVLSRGFEGGEHDIADVLSSLGGVARGLERNMKMVNALTAIVASVGAAVAAFARTHYGVEVPESRDAASPEEPPVATPAAPASSPSSTAASGS
jgi:hypothetical protein